MQIALISMQIFVYGPGHIGCYAQKTSSVSGRFWYKIVAVGNQNGGSRQPATVARQPATTNYNEKFLLLIQQN